MKALVIDDERLARKELISLLDKFPSIEIVGEAANGEEGIALIQKLKPELIFLDIQMPGMTGFDMLEKLEVTPQVIFVTAYDDYAIKAFEVNALDYLLKPVESSRLEKTIENVLEKAVSNEPVLNSSNQIFVKDGQKCFFVKLQNIRMFESEGNYVRLYFDSSKPMVLKSLNNLEKRLDEKEFFRISRKHIVNLTWIESVENWFNGGLRATLRTGEQLEISRRQATKFKEMMAL